jgi:hypothetical protein
MRNKEWNIEHGTRNTEQGRNVQGAKKNVYYRK